MHIKKGDNVMVRTGKDRGARGVVLRVFPSRDHVLIDGINVHLRHQRPRKRGEAGQVLSVPLPFASSNVALFCSTCKKGVRYGIEKDDANKKKRMCRQCGGAL